MASELGLPPLATEVPSLFQEDMASNLPSFESFVVPERAAKNGTRDLEVAIRRALDRAGWIAVRFALVESETAGRRGGPAAERDITECAAASRYFARDRGGAYFELEIEQRCKSTSTSTSRDPRDCGGGEPPPEYDLVLHLPEGARAGRRRKLVVDRDTCVTYTGRALIP